MMRKAFTMLELILALAILAILTVLTVKSITALRSSNRDNKRVLDVREIQTALEEYYHDAGFYPTAITPGLPIVYNNNTYIKKVPSYPTPMDGACAATTTYPYTRDSTGASYSVSFCLGYRTTDVGAGVNYAIPGDIVTCVPDCYLSCGAGTDDCGGTCNNAATCLSGFNCVNDHCLPN